MRRNFAILTICSGRLHPLTSHEVVPATTWAATFSAPLHLCICVFFPFVFVPSRHHHHRPLFGPAYSGGCVTYQIFGPSDPYSCVVLPLTRRSCFPHRKWHNFFFVVCVCMCVRLLFIIIMHSPPAWIHYTHATSCPQFNFLCRRGMLYIAHNRKYRPRRRTIMLKKKF